MKKAQHAASTQVGQEYKKLTEKFLPPAARIRHVTRKTNDITIAPDHPRAPGLLLLPSHLLSQNGERLPTLSNFLHANLILVGSRSCLLSCIVLDLFF